jgi:N-acetylmuramoyl-L-alanine amidase
MAFDSHRRLSRAELLRRAGSGLLGAFVAAPLLGRGLVDSAAAASFEPAVALQIEDVALPTRRGLASSALVLAQRATPQFHLVGLHWRGPGSVSFRTLDANAWSGWQDAVVHELADPDEASLDGWNLGTPVWTGGSEAIQLRVRGEVQALRAHYVNSPVEPNAARQPAVAAQPFILPRSSWGANEAIVRAQPSYADRLRFAVVHHTAGENPASPQESAAILRGIQEYHVNGNGWNDIGYNFLLDGFGQIFEGRGGGIDQNVVGAHALGFNTGSVGVAVLGNFETQVPADGVHTALVQLLTWRLDLGHVDPIASPTVTSSSGATRVIRAISGHRDVGSTACPGANLYPLLDGIAQEVAASGLPKLYDPLVEPVSDRIFRFTARLSDARPYAIAVTSPDGLAVAQTAGVGPTVDWTWDATLATDGSYSWRIDAGAEVTPAAGTLALGVVPSAPEPAEPPPRPARPRGIPRRIPRWAWELRRWHRLPTVQRGPRPAGTPRRLPSWYWLWFRWLNAVERWETTWGG